MKKADFWSREGEKVRCGLCPHACLLNEGQLGVCNVRIVENGELQTLVYGMAMALHADPIEKKPLFHFLPGARALSVGTAGCNLHCSFCQNWSLSQHARLQRGKRLEGQIIEPEALVERAVKHQCSVLAFTYSEPTIFFEYARDTAHLAVSHALKSIFVTNGYIEPGPLRSLKGFLHGANVDLKTFQDSTYREVMGGRLQPVLDAMAIMKHDLGIWVEVTTLVIPTINDSEGELREIAAFIRDVLGEETPWHVSRFHPDYHLTHLHPTPPETLRRAREIGMEEGLHFVYTGNLPGDPGETTYCPGCLKPVIRRTGFSVRKNYLQDGKCPECNRPLEGVWSTH